MPTVPLTKILFNRTDCRIFLKDLTGMIHVMTSDDMRSLAVALTQAEWAALKLALLQPEVWVEITSTTDKR